MNSPREDHAPLAPLPHAGHIFEASWPVRTGDIHSDRRLRLDAIARYLQDVGFDNLIASDALDIHPTWVVRRTVIDVVRPIRWPDRVHLRRWCTGISRKWCSMRVRIDSDDGGLVETEGFWINVDPKTGMPARISERFTRELDSTVVDQHLHWHRWITPEASDAPERSFPLRASDFDPFDHVNNAVYWQPAEEAMGEDLREKPFRSIIEYSQPITRGEQVTVCERADGRTLDIDVDGETRASARWFPLAQVFQG
ncbi:acyl-[acyl-carrier-protein] thioesterase [Rhodococcus sp. OK302]|uniref:acyl-[acyl-carrier-protein] thioesterase n=1 Tax=Rhodococcus sp. OK302 TaxID=1882769 RepID=UPI000B94311C|nr:acyl-ACP thioesterase domain-containing protein [Rhodococcus sp. OK302]OYD67237.1 acyl-ACP thioesterase [Rhodococcus sp. OK302]